MTKTIIFFKKNLILIVFLYISNIYSNDFKKSSFLLLSNGFQISGIKKEDFIQSNISNTYNLSWGKWINNNMGYMIGYRGDYFKYINDEARHYYSFFYSDILLNKAIFSKKKYKELSSIHLGFGYFYNKFNKNNIVCGNVGLINEFILNTRINAIINVSAIIGWDLYQNDEDILPSINFGIIYKYKS
tara:strand:+ start:5166 stop:5726 length:561 start_codon:yes stop_codon:yes gene_type:complete